MKKLLVWLLLASSACMAQSTMLAKSTALANSTKLGLSNLTLTPGWIMLQDWGVDCAASACSTTAASVYLPHPLTANSVRVMAVYCTGGQSTNVSITSATINNVPLTLCGSSCNAYNSGDDEVNIAYGFGTGGTGTPPMAVAMSGTCTDIYMDFMELILPGYAGAYDTAGVATSASCTTCTGPSLTTTETDAVYCAIDYSGSVTGQKWNSFGSPYITLTNSNNGLYINTSVGAQSAVTTTLASGYFAEACIAFKSNAGVFTVGTSPVMSLVNYATGPSQGPTTCSNTCSLTVPSTTSGNAGILVWGTNVSGYGHLSSATVGGSSLTVPAAASTSCVVLGVTSSTETENLGCAYITSLPASATSVSMTFSASAANAYFGWFELNRTSGSWFSDNQCSATDTASTNPVSCSLSPLSGSNDALIYCAAGFGGIGVGSLETQPWTANGTGLGGGEFGASESCGLISNTTTTTAPILVYENGDATAQMAIGLK